MSLNSEFHRGDRTQSVTQPDTPTVTARARERNRLTPSASIRLDAETIRAALSVLPTAVADGEE